MRSARWRRSFNGARTLQPRAHYIGAQRLNISGDRVFGFVNCSGFITPNASARTRGILLATVPEKIV
jgi:hypothetical protein